MDSSTPSAPPADAPDWSKQTEEIHCPLCDYNLRGLVEPRCPECGYRFEWIKLLDPKERVHPYLFEHYPNHNVWSFVRTLLGAILPGRFFRSLQPIQRSDAWRIGIYWTISVLMMCLAFGGLYAGLAVLYLAWNHPYWRAAVQWRMRPVQPMLLAVCCWPWVAAGILLIFSDTMKRVKIGRMHVLRCTIYSADFGPLLGALGVLVGCWVLGRMYPIVVPPVNLDCYWWTMLLVVWSTITWRLVQALRHYLRFPHAFGVVLAVQVIFLQLLLLTMLILQGYEGIVNVLRPRFLVR